MSKIPPKEKAKHIFNKVKNRITYCGQTESEIKEDTKDICIFLVDEIILYFTEEIIKPMEDHIEYFNEVKKEIDEL